MEANRFDQGPSLEGLYNHNASMGGIQEPPPTPPGSKIYIKIDRVVWVVFCVVNTLCVGFPWFVGAFVAVLDMTVRLYIISSSICKAL